MGPVSLFELFSSNALATEFEDDRVVDQAVDNGGRGHRILEDAIPLGSWLEQAGFEVETATTYGAFALPRRRVAFYATRR